MPTGWDEPRCVWCHKTGGDIEPLRVRVPGVSIFSDKEHDIDLLIHPEHRDETRQYYVRLYKHAQTFLWAIFLGIAALVAVIVLDWKSGDAALLSYFGIVLVVFPFANGTTFELVGIKNSVKFIQIIGAALIIGSSILLYVV